MLKKFSILSLILIDFPLLANESKGLPQLDFSTYPSLIFWSLISLVFMYLIMSFVITPRISSILNNREQHIQNDLIKAKSLKTESDQILEELNKQLEKTKIESRSLIEKSIHESQKNLEKLKSDTTNNINKNLEQSLSKIDNAKTEVTENIKKNILELSELVITKTLGLKLNKPKLVKILKENVNNL